MTDDSIGETLTSKSICEWQLMGEIGQRGLNLSDSASQILACCHHLHCGSALRLWIFHGQHLTPCPERYFSFFFSAPHRNPGVRVCHGSVKSVSGLEAKDRIYDALGWWHQVDIFIPDPRAPSASTDKPLNCPQFGVAAQKICFVCDILLSWEMIPIYPEQKPCFDKRWPSLPS